MDRPDGLTASFLTNSGAVPSAAKAAPRVVARLAGIGRKGDGQPELKVLWRGGEDLALSSPRLQGQKRLVK